MALGTVPLNIQCPLPSSSYLIIRLRDSQEVRGEEGEGSKGLAERTRLVDLEWPLSYQAKRQG